MEILNKKLAAVAATVALGASSLVFAAETKPQRHFRRNEALMQVLTDSQKAQAKGVFQQARESAKPIRQQMMENRKALRAAIESGSTDQIRKLSAAEGAELGQLMAIRGSAVSKVYQTLSPEQKQKVAELQQARRQAWHARRHEATAKSAS
jgi:Spy/CpxP family protein refolding chaperone